MNSKRRIVLVAALLLGAIFSGCKKKTPDPPSQIDSRACDSLDGVLSKDKVSLDTGVFCEGKGSLKVSAENPTTFPLYEIPYPPAENADLFLKAKVRGQDLAGGVALQLVVVFPNGGEFPVQGPSVSPADWQDTEVKATLPPGQKASKVKVNVIFDALGGSAWIDDIRLIKVPK
jgi:hypothetical protein